MKFKINEIVKLLSALFIMSIPLMPIFTIYGFYILGTLQIFIFFIFIIKNKFKLKISYFEISYLLLIFWNIISIKWSFTKELSLIKWMLIYFSFTYSFCYNLRECFYDETSGVDFEKMVSFFFKYFTIGTIVSSIICLCYEKIILNSTSRLGTYMFKEPYGTRMTYTYSLEIVLFYLIICFMDNKNKRIKLGIEICFLLLCTFLTGTRKIFVGMIVLIISYIIIKNKKNIFRVTFKILGIIILSLIGFQITMSVDFLYNSFGYRIESAINFTSGSTNADTSLRDRNKMIEYGMSEFKNHPLIGRGSNTFHSLFYIYYGQDLYSHNNYVELLCNLGLIGFLIYYSIYIVILISGKNKPSRYIFISMLLALMVMEYWTVSYYRIHFLTFLNLSIIYLTSGNKKEGEY